MNASQPLNPPSLFRHYIIRSAHAALNRIDLDAYVLTDEERERALHALGFAIQEEAAWPAAQELIRVIAPKMERAGYREEWVPYLQRGAKVSQALGDANTEAELHLRLGMFFQFRGDIELARAHFEKSKNGYADVGNIREFANSLNRLAFIDCMNGEFESAINLSLQGLELLASNDPDRAMHYNALGRVAYMRGETASAANYYRKGLRLREQEGDKQKIAHNLRDYGVILHDLREFGEAASVVNRAIELFTEIQDSIEIAASTSNLGLIYHSQNQMGTALEYYERARKIFWESGRGIDLAVVCMNIGLVHNHLEAWHDAELAFHASIAHWPAGVSQLLKVTLFEGMGIAQYHQERHGQAIEFLHQALDLLEGYLEHPTYSEQKAAVVKQMGIAQRENSGQQAAL